MRRVFYGVLSLVSLLTALIAGFYLVIHFFVVTFEFPGGCSEGIWPSTRPCLEHPPEALHQWVLNALASGALFTLLLAALLLVRFAAVRATGRGGALSQASVLRAATSTCVFTVFILICFLLMYNDAWVDWARATSDSQDWYPRELVHEGILTFGATAAVFLGLAVFLATRVRRQRKD